MSIWIPLLVALVTAGAALIGQVYLGKSNNAKLTNELFARIDKQSELSDEKLKGDIAVIKTELRTLSDRVEKHNNLIDRTYKLEQDTAVLQEKVTVANHRISDLEAQGK